MSSPYLTVQEVAKLARCEHRTVRRAIQAGKLKASLIGGRWIVRDSAVEEWIEGCANDAVPIASTSQPRRPRIREQARGPMRPGSVADLEAIRENLRTVSIQKRGSRYVVRWREGGRQLQRTFVKRSASRRSARRSCCSRASSAAPSSAD